MDFAALDERCKRLGNISITRSAARKLVLPCFASLANLPDARVCLMRCKCRSCMTWGSASPFGCPLYTLHVIARLPYKCSYAQDDSDGAGRASLHARRCPMEDFSDESLMANLPRAVAQLHDLMQDGHRVYVHCTAGMLPMPLLPDGPRPILVLSRRVTSSCSDATSKGRSCLVHLFT